MPSTTQQKYHSFVPQPLFISIQVSSSPLKWKMSQFTTMVRLHNKTDKKVKNAENLSFWHWKEFFISFFFVCVCVVIKIYSSPSTTMHKFFLFPFFLLDGGAHLIQWRWKMSGKWKLEREKREKSKFLGDIEGNKAWNLKSWEKLWKFD